MSIQDHWHWCNKCHTFFFSGNASQGTCPAGGQHDHVGSGDYALVQNDSAMVGQNNWRWCNKCQALCFAVGPNVGKCSAGGLHSHTGSGDYVV